MRKYAIAMAAASLAVGTAAVAKSPFETPPGQGPKVCLVTFGSAEDAATGADAGVVKAQYLPLAIAQKLEARNDDLADIYTYGEDAYDGDGVNNVLGGTMTTEETCSYLDALNEDDTEDDDD